MKKSLIITIGIALIILSVFVFEGYFSRDKNSGSDTSLSESKMKAIDAASKAEALNLAILMEDWSSESKQGYLGFMDSQVNKDKVQASIDAVAKEKNIKLDYFITSTNTNYVIRVKPISQDKSYCIDASAAASSGYVAELVSSTEALFKSKADCNGKAF